MKRLRTILLFLFWGITFVLASTSCHEPYPSFHYTFVESLPPEIMLAIQEDFPDSTILGQYIRSFRGKHHIYSIDIEDNKGLIHGTMYDFNGQLEYDRVYDDQQKTQQP